MNDKADIEQPRVEREMARVAAPQPVAQPAPQPVAPPQPVAQPAPHHYAPEPEPAPQPAQPPRPAPVEPAMSDEPILSQRAAAASLGSLETLSKLLVKPEPESDGTLEGLVQAGKFREDLFHRLNVIRIHIPRLADRREDIPTLAHHFLARAAQELAVEPKLLKSETEDYLKHLPWPGNVRQLENTCRWITVMASGREVHVDDLPPELLTQPQDAAPVTNWEQALRLWADQALARGQSNLLDSAVPAFERIMIETALKHTAGRRRDAALLLGWGRNTLTRKIKELGMKVDGADDDDSDDDSDDGADCDRWRGAGRRDPAVLLNFLRHAAQLLFVTAEQDNAGAVAGVGQRGFASDPVAGAGHQDAAHHSIGPSPRAPRASRVGRAMPAKWATRGPSESHQRGCGRPSFSPRLQPAMVSRRCLMRSRAGVG